MKKFSFCFLMVVISIIVLAASLLYQISPFKKTAKLLDAVKSRDVALVSQLLDEGADPNQTDIPPSRAWSFLEITAHRPIYYACANGDLEIVKLLIDHGATVDYQDNTGWSPLRGVLFRYDANDIEIVKLLLENGADPEWMESGNNSIFAAADMRPYSSDGNYDPEIARGITAIVQVLLGDRPVDMRGENGMTLLMVASRRGNISLVQYLIEHGCNPNLTDYQGKTAADYATASGAEDILYILNQV